MLYNALPRSLKGALLILAMMLAGALLPAGPAFAQPDEMVASDGPSGEPDGEARGEPSSDEPVGEPQASDSESGDGESRTAEPASGEGQRPAPSASPAEPSISKAAARKEAEERLFGNGGKKENPAETSPMLQNRGPDYYDRRAAEMLKEDQGAAIPEQHPLSAAYPNPPRPRISGGTLMLTCTSGCVRSQSDSSAATVSITQ